MKELETWLDRRARADQRIPCLDDVFLSGRFTPYARYRLRLFFLRWFTASVVHLVRVVLLSAAFSRQSFLQLLLAEAAVGFASSFWWGALESMREQIRALHRQGQAYRIPAVIERWLTAAWALTGIVLGACGVWLVTRQRSFGPFELYAVALFIRLALQFVTRTFHSGAYALRRIYRPGWAVVAVEMVSFGFVLLIWPVAGAWALPIGTIAAAVAGSAITIHFTQRLYKFVGMVVHLAPVVSGLALPRRCRAGAPTARTLRGGVAVWGPGFRRTRPKIAWVDIVGAGLSFAVMKLDAVLVFGLFDARVAAPGEIQLFLLLFVMGPTIQAGFDWAHLFYFDLKRLHITPLAPLLELYRTHITRLAWVMGAVFWVFASVIGTVVYFRSLGALYWLFGPFFVARSLAASAQIQAFSLRCYGLLLGSASLWLAGFALATQIPADFGKLAVVTVATTAVYVVLSRMASPAAPYRDTCLGVVEWLRMLASVSGPVRIRSAMLRPVRRRGGEPRAALRALRWSRREFARMLATKLKGCGAVTIVPPDRVVWFEVGATEIRRQTIAALSDGVAQRVRETRVYRDGRAAAASAWREHGLEAAFGRLDLERAQSVSPGELQRQFARLFPDGWVFTPGAPALAASGIQARWRRRIINSASRYLAELGRSRDKSPLDVTALCVAGRLCHVFVAPKDGRSASRRRWKRTIQRANVLAAFEPDVIPLLTTASPRVGA